MYEHDFGWPPGDGYFGAFEMTADNIADVFGNTNKPLRTKLKLMYNAVRNNALSKWLKVAGLQLDRAARRKKPTTIKVRSEGQSVDRSGPTEKRVSKSKKENVSLGFAAASGIAGLHDAAATQELIAHAKAEKRLTGSRFAPGRRNLFDHANFSNTVGWKPATHEAHKERTGNASKGIDDQNRRHLTVANVPDLTDEEIELMMLRRGVAGSTPATSDFFRANPNNELSWSQGRDDLDVNLGSNSAKEAARLKARMESGISGSTDLMLHAGQHLGVKNALQMMPLRLALAGWMIAARDHSFYEVFKAAQAYGLRFNVDPARPGAEYEDAGNLIPMQRQDFAGILPAVGTVNQVFPAYYQSTAWKDHLAATLNAHGQTAAGTKNQLTASGVEKLSLSVMNERDLAAMQSLEVQVRLENDLGSPDKQKRKMVMKRVKEDSSYIYLGNVFGAKRSLRSLIELVGHIYNLANFTEVELDDVPAEHRPAEQIRQGYIAR